MNRKKHAVSTFVELSLSRRRFLIGSVAAGAAVALAGRVGARPMSPQGGGAVTIENFSAAGRSEGTVQVARIVKDDAAWRAQLSPEAFEVTRRAGTERAFTGAYLNNHRDGLYRCICCDTALFDARTKFESGTGWPSFWQPISHFNVVESGDDTLGMRRTAVSCRRCDAHLGHVFDDGPKPTGLRYCMNSVALRFVERA